MHLGLWGATRARGSVPRTSVTDLHTLATVTGSNPQIPLRMPSPSEGVPLVFFQLFSYSSSWEPPERDPYPSL